MNADDRTQAAGSKDGHSGATAHRDDEPNYFTGLKNFPVRLAGAHGAWIANNSERTRLWCMGLSLIVVPMWAAGGVIAAATVVRDGKFWWPSCIVAAMWATAVFMIDRWIISSPNYGDLTAPGEKKQGFFTKALNKFWFYGSRIFLSVLVGIVISESVALAVFNGTVEEELKSIHAESVKSAQIQIDQDPIIGLAGERQQTINRIQATADTNQKTAQTAETNTYNDWQDELNGTGGTRQSGRSADGEEGDRYREYDDARKKRIAADQALAEANEKKASDEAILSTDRQTALAERTETIENNRDILVRHEGLMNAVFRGGGVFYGWLILTLILLSIDLIPVLYKLFGPPNLYDRNARRFALSTTYGEAQQTKNNIDLKLLEDEDNLAEGRHRNLVAEQDRKVDLDTSTAAAQRARDQINDAVTDVADPQDPDVINAARAYLDAAIARLADRARQRRASSPADSGGDPSRPASHWQPFHEDPTAATPFHETPAQNVNVDGQELFDSRPSPSAHTVDDDTGANSGSGTLLTDEFGLDVGKKFPDPTAPSVNTEKIWEIIEMVHPLRYGMLYRAREYGVPNGPDYAIKTYTNLGNRGEAAEAYARAEQHALPEGFPINDNLAQIHFAGSYKGDMVVVTKYFRWTLAQYHRERLHDTNNRFSLEESIDLASQILTGVSAVWTRRDDPRAHCDLKPANIGVDDDADNIYVDGVKIFDWGLSQAIVPPNMTTTRLKTGSVFYAPVEQQFYEANVWPRFLVAADVHAWAAVLYTLLIGAAPREMEALRMGIDYDNGGRDYEDLMRRPIGSITSYDSRFPRSLAGALESWLSPVAADRVPSAVSDLPSREEIVEKASQARETLFKRLKVIKEDIERAGIGAMPVGHFEDPAAFERAGVNPPPSPVFGNDESRLNQAQGAEGQMQQIVVPWRVSPGSEGQNDAPDRAETPPNLGHGAGIDRDPRERPTKPRPEPPFRTPASEAATPYPKRRPGQEVMGSTNE